VTPGAVTPLRATAPAPRRIGDILVGLGFASRAEVEAALAAARVSHAQLGRELLEREVITEDQLAEAVAARYGLPFVDLATFDVDPGAAALVPPDGALRLQALPIARDGSHLRVAMANPGDVVAADDVAMLTGCEVERVGAAPSAIEAFVTRVQRERYADVGEGPAGILARVDVDVRESPDQAPVINLLNSVIARGIEQRASDIHLDWDDEQMRVRYRIDGMTQDVTTVPLQMAPGVISRIKIMASLDIGERQVPQDGRISLVADGEEVDVRVVTLPVVRGESAVLRILNRSGETPQLDALGMSAHERARFDDAIERPYGGILATGPTGSGKTTTLYGVLGLLNERERTIITIEDPVEYRLDGIKQIQVSGRRGLTFPRGLRAILRADPDVVLVGEIRDGETAQIAVEAALTGHLVLSTLHTNDAPGAVARLLEMGVEPFLVASSVVCVVGQRLARVLCPHCKLRSESAEGFEAVGCAHCRGTGYVGRAGLFEVMPVTPEISALILERRPVAEIAAKAAEQGMRPMHEDGMDKVRAGVTSLAEVMRVVAR
jgi:type IV pilus assembly protein PilB